MVWSQASQGVRLRLRVQPRSSRTGVTGVQGEALKVCVNAAPVDGAANDAVVDLLAGWLDVPRRTIRIVQGTASRDKVIEIATDSPQSLGRHIETKLAGCVDKAGTGD